MLARSRPAFAGWSENSGEEIAVNAWLGLGRALLECGAEPRSGRESRRCAGRSCGGREADLVAECLGAGGRGCGSCGLVEMVVVEVGAEVVVADVGAGEEVPGDDEDGSCEAKC